VNDVTNSVGEIVPPGNVCFEPLAVNGELPGALQGQVGLALPDGRSRVVVLPAAPPSGNRYEREIVGSLGLDGRFSGRITVTALGTEQGSIREKFADIDRKDAQARNELLRSYARAVYESATMDSAHYFDGRDLSVAPHLTVWLTATKVIGRGSYMQDGSCGPPGMPRVRCGTRSLT